MNIDLAAHIERLLFQHDTLVLPGLGGFVATRTPASVDYATNTVHPPTKTLTFSENLSVDDGFLVEDVAQTYRLSVEEARCMVETFVEDIQRRLDQRDIVSINGVGRLYKNYLQKIQFLPDPTNFNTNAFGLPPLQFSPLARSREIEGDGKANDKSAIATGEAVPPIPSLPSPPPVDSTAYMPTHTSAGQFGLGIGLGLILCSIVFGIWWWQSRKERPAPTLQDQISEMERAKPTSILPDIAGIGQPIAPEPTPKSQTPSTSLPEIDEPDLDDEVTAHAEERGAAFQRLQQEATSLETSQRPAAARQCVLIVATLSNPENADRLAATLEAAGYTVYDRPHARGRQVGISFSYTHPQEIEAKKAELVRLTNEKKIFVKSK